MAFANVWIALRQEAQVAIRERRGWDEEVDGPYTGAVTDREARLFHYMSDLENTERLWKKATINGKEWTIWNVTFTESLPAVKIELDKLLADRPNHVKIISAWKWDGSQHGTEHVFDTRIVTKTWSVLNPDYQPDDQEPDFDPRFVLRITGDVEETYISGHTGTPLYPRPISLNLFLRFMPDDVDGNPATAPADVNLLMGQSPRQFF